MKQRLFLLITLATVCLLSNNSKIFAQENKSERPIVIMSEITFDAKDVETAIEILTNLQMDTLEKEEGCVAFDLLQNEANPNIIYIYEDFENEAAYKKHTSSSYYKEYLTNKLKPLIKSQKVTTLYPINDTGE